jgi:hypothetical protein
MASNFANKSKIKWKDVRKNKNYPNPISKVFFGMQMCPFLPQ